MTTVLVGRHWREPRNEFGFISRNIAGAASRVGPVTVLAPGSYGSQTPDGLFDVTGLGHAGSFRMPSGVDTEGVMLVDECDEEIYQLLRGAGNRHFYLSDLRDSVDTLWRRVGVVPDLASRTPYLVRPHIPINPLAEEHRHHGFGFTNYILVLSGQSESPPDEVAWLSAALHQTNIVVVSDAVAFAWRGRTLRGQATVDTRTDLWRLVAHASVCIDLDPGPLIARECVEALRFGTPIAVPEASGPAATHARSGGGFTFRDVAELIEAAARMLRSSDRSAVAARGRRYADATYGDSAQFVADVRTLLID